MRVRDELQADKRLPDVVFKPYQPRARLAESLSVADLHLVSLDPRFAGLVYPSKIYGIEAAGRPWIWLRPGLEVEDLRRAASGRARVGSLAAPLAQWREMLEGQVTNEVFAAFVGSPLRSLERPGSTLRG